MPASALAMYPPSTIAPAKGKYIHAFSCCRNTSFPSDIIAPLFFAEGILNNIYYQVMGPRRVEGCESDNLHFYTRLG